MGILLWVRVLQTWRAILDRTVDLGIVQCLERVRGFDAQPAKGYARRGGGRKGFRPGPLSAVSGIVLLASANEAA